MADTPQAYTSNPGSMEALGAGCRCPVFANDYGRPPPYPWATLPDTKWEIAEGCPLHDRAARRTDGDERDLVTA